MTAGKRDLEKRLARLERGRPCLACRPGTDDENKSDPDAAVSTGEWVADRLVVVREGDSEPEITGSCSRCGREKFVIVVVERVVPIADSTAATRADGSTAAKELDKVAPGDAYARRWEKKTGTADKAKDGLNKSKGRRQAP